MRWKSALGSNSLGDRYYHIAGPPTEPRLCQEAADGAWSTPFTTLEQLQTWEQHLGASSASADRALLGALQQQVGQAAGWEQSISPHVHHSWT
jgi:hypothetical protein